MIAHRKVFLKEASNERLQEYATDIWNLLRDLTENGVEPDEVTLEIWQWTRDELNKRNLVPELKRKKK